MGGTNIKVKLANLMLQPVEVVTCLKPKGCTFPDTI